MSTPAELLADCLVEIRDAEWPDHGTGTGVQRIQRLADRVLRQLSTRPPQAPPRDAEPVAYLRTRNGEIDWAEDCLYSKRIEADFGGFDHPDEYGLLPLYTHAPDTSAERRDAERFTVPMSDEMYRNRSCTMAHDKNWRCEICGTPKPLSNHDLAISILGKSRWYQDGHMDAESLMNVLTAIARERAGQNNQGEK